MKSENNTSEKKTEAKHLPNSEQLQLQTNVQEQENSNESGDLIQRIPIEGTPFTAIKLEHTKWFLAIGKNRITEPNYEYEELLRMIDNKNWELIVNTVLVIVENMTEIRKTN